MKVIEINASWGCAPTIDLGQRGENLATEVRFDFAGWAEEFGAPGAVELYVRRAGETTPYPVALTIEDTVAVWPVSAIDTHIIGLGEAELVYLIDGAVVKTAVYGTAVEPDIGQPDGTPPDPYETWMEALGEMAAGTLINAQRAETAQGGAEAAQTAAEAAQSAAETAQEASEAAQTGAEAAQTAAEASQTAAESAQTGAETAQTRAESAATNAANSASQSLDSATAAAASAATAQSAASTATQKATEAASSSSSAATSASTATQKATEAANSATSAQNWALDAAQDATTAASASDDAQRYATNASASATAAAQSATAAAASASAAAASETAAGNSATAASASETAAEAAQAAAEAVLESIPQDYSALSDEVDGLKSAVIFPVETTLSWEQGNLSTTTGGSTTTDKTKYIRTTKYYKAQYGFKFTPASGYILRAFKYTAQSISTFQGYKNYASEVTIVDSTNYYKFVIYNYTGGTVQTIVPADNTNVGQVLLKATDDTLSIKHMAADAKATGDAIAALDSRVALQSTGDTTDRTAEIEAMLQTYKSCVLGSGVFYTTGITMPEGTGIFGQGAATSIELLPSDNTNKWSFGDKTFTKYTTVVFDTPLPKGRYRFTADVVSSDTDSTICTISFYHTSPYTSTNRVGLAEIARGTGKETYVDVTDTVEAISISASNTFDHAEGDTATYSNVSLNQISTAITLGNRCTVKDVQISGSATSIETPTSDGDRHGIGYYGTGRDSTISRCIIDGCYIRRFAGGGIYCFNTGYGVNGMNIANCYVYSCYAGIYIPFWSEFHRVVNCSLTGNHYGVLNNGGNNTFANCNMSSNAYGFAMDNGSGDRINGAHGEVTGCTMQHNTVNAVYIDNQASGFLFSGCNIDNGGLYVKDSYRNVFNACNFMDEFTITVSGGGLRSFNACNFRSDMVAKTSITSNTAVKFNACYTAGGTAVDPTA